MLIIRTVRYVFIFVLLLAPLSIPSKALGQASIHQAASSDECVILLHGLARSARSMRKMEHVLEAEGFRVRNVDYPSRKMEIEALAYSVIPQEVEQCRRQGARQIHFVTHSMGGILVRTYLQTHTIDELGRVVMLSPPNQGSEVINKLGWIPGFKFLYGPAGLQLGTETESIPMQLGPVDYPVGVITGDKSINWILSLLIPGPDDGKVSVERAQVEGMIDFLVVSYPHPVIMRSRRVIEEVVRFLRVGAFGEKQIR